jgi:hypothetical protein
MDLETASKMACAETNWDGSGPPDRLLAAAARAVAERSGRSYQEVYEAASQYCEDLLRAPGASSNSQAPSVQPDDSEAWQAAITSCSVDAYGFALLQGQVANDSSRTRSYQVSIVLDGSNGLRAGSGVATASSIPAGGIGSFEFRTSVSSASGAITDCRIERVTPN